jgi:predicted RND superfamily exporter protein
MSRKSRHWLWLLMLIPIGIGFARLRFDVEVLNLLPGDSPVVQGLKLYQQNFANARELIITLKSPEADQAESAALSLTAALRAATNLVAAANWQPPWLENPAQATELVAYLWLNQPPEVFGRLTNRLAETNLPTILQAAREQLATSLSPGDIARLSYDPYGLLNLPEAAGASAPSFQQGQEFFASVDGTFRIIFVKAAADLAKYRETITWLNQIKAIEQSWRKENQISAEVKVNYTGGPPFVSEIAGSMEHDMTHSVGLTAIIIAILFWLAHRRWIPMLWLLVLLGLILTATLAIGGLLFGTINVVSLGFAAILLGLAVDYGVVHYQEALAKPQAIVPEIRRAIGPSIFWAAVTTISAFLVLNLGGLPGLAQLGSLVALGVAISALVMLFAFLPPLFRDRMKKRQEQIDKGIAPAAENVEPKSPPPSPFRVRSLFTLTALLVLVAGFVLSFGFPALDHTANALRPQNSAAYAALDEIKLRLNQKREPLWLIITGTNEQEIARRLDQVTVILERAVSNRFIDSFTLPTPLWPRPDFQKANQKTVVHLLAQQEKLREAALTQGFNTNSLGLLDNVFTTWQTAIASPNVFWPTNEVSRWILEKMVARSQGDFLVFGLIFPASRSPVTLESVAAWSNDLARAGFIVSGWELLGASVLQRVQQNLARVVWPMIFLVLLSLWLAFRRLTEIILSLAVLLLSGLCLLVVMRCAGWSWNLLNLMALPLMLGSGVDYSIFMQLALRRHHGDLSAAYRSVGRALLLCGGTAVAGFGSLSLSTNSGMASLGQVCAVGIGSNMLISVYLLPLWWRATAGRNKNKN